MLNQENIQFFNKICNPENVIFDSPELVKYASDATEDLHFLPSVVLFPNSVQQISEILKYCNENLIPVTTRGAGTGLSGGALPVKGGLVLSIKNLNKIINIDTQNFQARVQSGVINQVFADECEKKGLFYPPDPASRGSCFMGGNIGHGSGGPKAVKYGTTRDYILSLQVVLPDGSVIETGASVLKNSTGYNLTQIMIGSEGTLGIVTEITVRLIPIPQYNLLALARYNSEKMAAEHVNEIFKYGITPSVCELITKKALDIAIEFTHLSLNTNVLEVCYLLIEIDGNDPHQLNQQMENLGEILVQSGCSDLDIFYTDEQKSKMWKIRRAIGEATKFNNIYKEEDIVVPRFSLPDVLEYIRILELKYGFRAVVYGHAGDGNLHVNILKDKLSDSYWNYEITDAIKELFTYVKKLGGTISGEHGIGYTQKNYISIALPDKNIEIMKGIKSVFDPYNILNPGKIWPD